MRGWNGRPSRIVASAIRPHAMHAGKKIAAVADQGGAVRVGSDPSRPASRLFAGRYETGSCIGTFAEEVLFHLCRQVLAGAGIG